MTEARYIAPHPEVLWCANAARDRGIGWRFPPKVEALLREATQGKTVLQMFGGQSRWGVRLDIDRQLRPDVIGDAWLPPFVANAFDVVILDPPYIAINQQMKQALLRQAAYVARERVYWFHTLWIAGDSTMRRERSWLVRVGDSCNVRCLIEWRVRMDKTIKPVVHFTRGPAMKYNRWLYGELPLPFPGPAELPE